MSLPLSRCRWIPARPLRVSPAWTLMFLLALLFGMAVEATAQEGTPTRPEPSDAATPDLKPPEPNPAEQATADQDASASSAAGKDDESKPQAPAPKEPGLELFDRAMQAKIDANQMNDLDLVVSLCREAIKKGLSESNQQFAREMISATLYEKANRLVDSTLRGQPEPNWGQRRSIAEVSLQESIENDPKHGESRLLLARIQALPGGKIELGKESADRAIELLAAVPARQSIAYLTRAQLEEDPAKQIEYLDQAIKLDDLNYDAVQERGRSHLLAGNTEEALADFMKILSVDDQNLDALNAVARVFTIQEKYDEALKYVDRMLEVDDGIAEPYVLRARIRMIEDKPKDALPDLDRAVRMEPRDLATRLLRATVLSALDRSEDALKDVDEVLELAPGLEQARFLRISLLASSGKTLEAADELEYYSRRDPDNVDLKLQLAQLYAIADQPRRAIALLSEILSKESPPWQAYRSRGDAYLAVGDHAKAVADYDKALALEPKDSGVLNNLAWVLATSPFEDVRNGKRAVELGKLACEVTDYAEAHILSTLAAGYAEAGDFEEAIKWSTKAVELGTGDMKTQLEEELKSYQSKKPFRELKEAPTESANSESRVDATLDDLKLESPGAETPTVKDSTEPPTRIPADP